MSRQQSTVVKATSLPPVVVHQSTAIKHIYSLVLITIQAKASRSVVLATLLAHVGLDTECLLDPDLMHGTNSADASESSVSISTSRIDFIHRISARDGACVMVNDKRSCEACHIVPHSKGHQVMFRIKSLAIHSEFSFLPSSISSISPIIGRWISTLRWRASTIPGMVSCFT
jgi:hypothetical protein